MWECGCVGVWVCGEVCVGRREGRTKIICSNQAIWIEQLKFLKSNSGVVDKGRGRRMALPQGVGRVTESVGSCLNTSKAALDYSLALQCQLFPKLDTHNCALRVSL